jgi:hypothetical protein
MNCHNERMIKIRKHAQKKAERERAANGGSGSSRSRETEARNIHRDQEVMWFSHKTFCKFFLNCDQFSVASIPSKTIKHFPCASSG